jgi:predicted metal-dependent hydrolase
MRFDVDASVPFQWNVANPASGVMSNSISFIAVGFERYIVLAVKEALKLITDPELRVEAEVFTAQEAQHSAAHRKHVNAMIARYPGLAATMDWVNKSYEELFAAEPLEFHLAYIASLEATFPPLFSFMIEHRDELFNGDARVASLFLWHYVEEIEHRSSAATIYDGVVGNRWYQLRTMPRVMSHVVEVARTVAEGFSTSVPAEDMGVDPRAATGAMWRAEALKRIPLLRRFAGSDPTMFDDIPTPDVLRLLGGLAQSQLPHHHPGDVATPDWFHTWMHSYAAGADMAHFFGVPQAQRD